MSYIRELTEKKLAHPPSWLSHNIHYETMMGSVAYGVSSDTSDMDIYSWCIPPKDEIFPHLRGEVIGFGTQKHRFSNYQEHHLKDSDAMGGKGREYDVCCYNIVDYFQLVMQNNPNMIDSLFTSDNCVLHITRVGTMVRERRKMFLHKKCWHTFKGYAYQQVKMMTVPDYWYCQMCDAAATYDEYAQLPNGPQGPMCAKCGTPAEKRKVKRKSEKRQETVEKYGYDIKFAYHVVRLLNEVEMIMAEGDLDLQRNREQLKSIRRGEWTEQQIRDYFSTKEKELETLYEKSTLPWGPDEAAIKKLLLDCLEEHYGSLSKCIEMPDKYKLALDQIAEIARNTMK